MEVITDIKYNNFINCYSILLKIKRDAIENQVYTLASSCRGVETEYFCLRVTFSGTSNLETFPINLRRDFIGSGWMYLVEKFDSTPQGIIDRLEIENGSNEKSMNIINKHYRLYKLEQL